MACSAQRRIHGWKAWPLLSEQPSLDTAALLRELPQPPRPQGGYVPAVIHREVRGLRNGLLVTAGMTPRVDGVVQYAGQVGSGVSLEDARAAASIAVENALAAALATLAWDEQLDRVLRLTVYVNAAAGFDRHTAVADGASTRLRELLCERGDAARSAVGVTSLPGGACVELELTCAWWASAS